VKSRGKLCQKIVKKLQGTEKVSKFETLK